MHRIPGSARAVPAQGRRPRKVLTRALIGLPALAVAVAVPATSASANGMSTVSVSVTGADSPNCGDHAHPCKTIMQGVERAGARGSVQVGPGTYHEQVVLSQQVDLQGRGAVIDATGLKSGSGQQLNVSGVLVTPAAGRSSISGFTVRGAYGEGILVQGASHVTVRGNTVTGNDLDTTGATGYQECQPQGKVPGDCGEGLHLMSSSHSSVLGNVVTHNSGGILVTDEFGPATGNRIEWNRSADNLADCGITLPSHNPNALDANGHRQPAKAGVYGNLVAYNTVTGNGMQGDGAGVLIAAAGPGMAAYDNSVIGNFISGNGMPGVTIHSHAPNQDVSGNVMRFNTIGTNNLRGDPDAGDMVTTGILVFSAVVPQSEHVSGNTICGNQKPIWTSDNIRLLP